MSKRIFMKMSTLNGIAPNTQYDLVDNNGFFVFQQLSGTTLLSGLTVSVADNTSGYTLGSIPQTATWSTSNPQYYGVNCPSWTASYAVVATASTFGVSSGTASINNIPVNGSISTIVIAACGDSVIGVTDSNNNTYTGSAYYANSGINTRILYVPNPVLTPYMSWTITASYFSGFIFLLTGPSSPTPFIDGFTGSNNSGTTLFSNSINPSQNNEFLIAIAGTGNPASGSPSTISGWSSNSISFSSGLHQGAVVYYQTQGSTSSVGVTFSSPGSTITYFSAIMASFGGYSVVVVPTTYDPSNKGTTITLSNGNLSYSANAGGSALVRSTTSHTVIGAGGLIYAYEVTITTGGSSLNEPAGIVKSTVTNFSQEPASVAQVGGVNVSYTYYGGDGNVYKSGATIQGPTTTGAYINGDIIGVVFDCNAGVLRFYKNGVLGITISGITGTWYAMSGFATGGSAGGLTNAVFNVSSMINAASYGAVNSW
jgi:SPRY domain